MPSSASLPIADSHVATLRISSHISSRNLLSPTQGTVGFHLIPCCLLGTHWKQDEIVLLEALVPSTLSVSCCYYKWSSYTTFWLLLIASTHSKQNACSVWTEQKHFFLNYENIWKHFPMKTFSYLNCPVGYDWLPCHSKFYILVRKERLPAPVASHLLILTNKAVFFLVSYVH